MHKNIDFSHIMKYLRDRCAMGEEAYLDSDELEVLITNIEQMEYEIESLESIIDGRDNEDNKRPAPSLQ